MQPFYPSGLLSNGKSSDPTVAYRFTFLKVCRIADLVQAWLFCSGVLSPSDAFVRLVES